MAQFRTFTQRVTLMNVALRNRSLSLAVWATMALFLCVTPAPIARADPASCLEKVSSYVAEVDHLLAREKDRITPFQDLNKRYFEFRDCDTDALLEAVWRSPFLIHITYNPQAKKYYIRFSSKEVEVGFAFSARDRKSSTLSAGWVNK
jgi:hypothetical protein